MTLKTKAFGDIITFTRASGGGRFNSSGVYEYVGNNVPRLDYDPVTGECRGLLIEESRTNLLTYSDASNWPASRAARGSSSFKMGIGGTTYIGVTDDQFTAFYASRAVSGLTAGSYTLTARIADANNDWSLMVVADSTVSNGIRVWVNNKTGAIGINNSFGTGISFVKADAFVTTGILTVNVTVASQLTTLRTHISPTTPGNGISSCAVGDSAWIGGIQLEVGAFPTSYIPTTTAQVTRAADVASVNDLSPWYNASEGTLFVDVVPMALAGGTLFSLDGGTVANQIWSSPNTGINGAYMYAAGAMQVQITGGTAASGAALKHALSFRQNDCAFVVNGVVIGSDTSFITPTVSKLNIGARWNSTGRFNGHIRSIRYWPRRLSNTELQEITA